MWRLLLLHSLAACSGAASGPCRLQPVADLPVTLDGNRLEVTARVDGADTTLLLDTGAESTVLRAHRFRTLALGADSVAGPLIGVAAFNLRGAAMLIGVDYLRTRRVWVAYRTGQLFIQDAPGR